MKDFILETFFKLLYVQREHGIHFGYHRKSLDICKAQWIHLKWLNVYAEQMILQLTLFPLLKQYSLPYIRPYLQNADHMRFQISNVNYPHYHNHLDTNTARWQTSWQGVYIQSTCKDSSE